MFDLTGRVAVITGASGGLGRQFTLALARQGADVVILARRQEKLEEVAEEVRALGRKCLAVKTDVTKLEDIKHAVKTVMEEFGKVDILINNAGGANGSPLTDFCDEKWDATMALSLTSVMQCTREFGREMVKAGYGRVVNVSSILGAGGLPEVPVADYHAAKGGVTNFTRGAAAEWGKTGVTVNAICPGFFQSEVNTAEAMEAMSGFINGRTPMGRPGKDGELDSAIVFLSADESSYVTGLICYVDGGWTAI